MKYTVIGAGHGGQAMAGYLSLQGHETVLYNRTSSILAGIRQNNGIELKGRVNAKATDIFLTNDVGEAIHGADIIMLCVPANAHESVATAMAPHIRDGQHIVLNPGRTLGAYYFVKTLRKCNCHCRIEVAETDTFILTSRKIKDGLSDIISFKNAVYLAASSVQNATQICEMLADIFPMIRPVQSYVYTSMANIGAVFHPLPAIFNIGRIENKQLYLHYKEGITPSICRLMEELDLERTTLATALGERVPSAEQWLKNVYGSTGIGLYETLQNTSAYDTVFAPTEISTRYIYEDITCGIVPMRCLAHVIGSPRNILALIIDMATHMFKFDFMGQGRHDVEGFIQQYLLVNRELPVS